MYIKLNYKSGHSTAQHYCSQAHNNIDRDKSTPVQSNTKVNDTHPSKNVADKALLIAKGRYNKACFNKISISQPSLMQVSLPTSTHK